MTAIIGVLCKNGAVIGADSSATFVHGQQFRTIEQPTEKLCIVDDSIIIAGSGPIGLDQRFCAIVKDAWQKKLFQTPALEIAKLLTNRFFQDLQQTFLKPGQYGALMAFPAEHKANLCEFAIPDFQPELKTEKIWYCSIGSTQPITDPFLALMREIYWQEGPPDTQDGIFTVTWALEHAVAVNPGGVNKPIYLAVLETKKGQAQARLLKDDELDEHRQNVKAAKEQLRELRRQHQGILETETPDVPRPKRV